MIAIGEASKQSGVGIEAIRYYEREGVVPKPQRGANGRRAYSSSDVARLRFVKTCRDLGFPIADTKVLLSLSEGQNSDCNAARVLGERQLGNVRQKISELQQLEEALCELTSNCKSGSVTCPMLTKLSQG